MTSSEPILGKRKSFDCRPTSVDVGRVRQAVQRAAWRERGGRCRRPCFLIVRPRKNRHLAVFGMPGPLVRRPRGARDQRLCRPAQHDRRRTRGQETVSAEVSSLLPARNRVQWACYDRRSRNPARLGCCVLHQARLPGKSR